MKRERLAFGMDLYPDGEPCPRCHEMALQGRLRAETVQPLHPVRVRNALAREHPHRYVCRDCQAADSISRTVFHGLDDFEMARVAVGGCRQEQYRLPGAPMGLVQAGFMQPCVPGELEAHLDWLDRVFGEHWRDEREDLL